MTLFVGNSAMLDAFRRGEAKTLERVYSDYSDVVARALAGGCLVHTAGAAVRMRLGPQDLESALQETFVRAFSNNARLAYDGRRPFVPWLLAIARHAMLDTLRACDKFTRDALRVEDLSESLAAPAPSPEALTLESEERTLVARFLGCLPPGDRLFAQVRFGDGQTQEATARLLCLTRAQVRLWEEDLRREMISWLNSALLTPPSTSGFSDRRGRRRWVSAPKGVKHTHR